METRYHIGLLTGTLLILAILSYAYYADYNYRKEIARTEQTEQQETEQTVSTQGGAHKEGVYYLKNRNGYARLHNLISLSSQYFCSGKIRYWISTPYFLRSRSSSTAFK